MDDGYYSMKSNALCLVGFCSGFRCGLSGNHLPLHYVFGLCSGFVFGLSFESVSLQNAFWSLQ